MWEQSPESMAQPLLDKPYDASITKRQNEKAQTGITCNNCHQTGHRASVCTKPRPCTECGEAGHWRKECPNRRCKWCDKTDHLADKCPEDLCLWCFQVGHLARECNNPRAKCDKCDAPHLTRLCRGRGGTLKKKRKGKAKAQQQIIQNRGRPSIPEEFNAMDGAQADTGGDTWGATQTGTDDYTWGATQTGTDDYTWGATQTGTGDITKEVKEANGCW
ncbi:hypothetical protein NW752_000357 [Fusarium irregulare]|uniref:CCHC-type domain-containing protein n=1 Tax=Fusarium irregulare TaxID=2494466 RepID=A0A9W8Q025_9HYPO|nr:hypothetical protein NW766_001474 [Fusarium irregulare]KAJ4028100.1 hypothetical protein NW752_000357 [Fusarium irregulare]